MRSTMSRPTKWCSEEILPFTSLHIITNLWKKRNVKPMISSSTSELHSPKTLSIGKPVSGGRTGQGKQLPRWNVWFVRLRRKYLRCEVRNLFRKIFANAYSLHPRPVPHRLRHRYE